MSDKRTRSSLVIVLSIRSMVLFIDCQDVGVQVERGFICLSWHICDPLVGLLHDSYFGILGKRTGWASQRQ